jgi:Cu2+-exporting ATPase
MNAAGALHARWSDAGEREHVVFAVEGMRCAGCARAIETAVRSLPDVQAVSVNAATARVSVDWLGHGATGLEQILRSVAQAGFKPIPLAGNSAAAEYQRERRAALKRVGLASLGMMQAMMYLGALYGASDIDAAMSQLMRLAGMIIVTPVLFYSGAPFFAGAWRDLHHRRLGMDVPVALALVLAFVPSVVNTFRGAGEVYFDSVGMFIFFLSLGRFIEMSVRHRGLTAAEALARSLPAQVTRIAPDGSRHKVPAAELVRGDRFVVAKGGVIAVDAELPADAPSGSQALLDESLVSGESAAVSRGAGEGIRGGSLNLGDSLTLIATAPAAGSTLASLVALLERAQGERPRLARAADRAASWFVLAILLLAGATAVWWWKHDSSQALAAVLAVLVVSCPCALSLATPAALAAATSWLARQGVLVTRADAIERLAQVDTVMFDKTGTLTGGANGVTGVTGVIPLSTQSPQQILAIAAALESDSSHPLAAAFSAHVSPGLRANSLREIAGEGLEGVVGGRHWRLGRREFASAGVPPGNVLPLHGTRDGSTIFLGDEQGLVAAIEVGVPLRGEAAAAADGLRALGIELAIASGDQEAATASAARALHIQRAHSRLTPAEKLWLVRQLRDRGHRVCMVGDGINDGPVLAAAHVSCAMGRGSGIAQSAADVLLVNEDLTLLPRMLAMARRAMRVVRQNLGWSLAYNFTAVPLAASGLVSPWLAALGMSLSSLLVVLNARRLAGGGAQP